MAITSSATYLAPHLSSSQERRTVAVVVVPFKLPLLEKQWTDRMLDTDLGSELAL
jgi:hypothetical protein